jgi:hypothetical protein
MKLFSVKAVVLCLLIVAGCKKDKDEKPSIKIEGFDIYDQVGVPVGHFGPDDTDWRFTALSQQELALFNFPTPDINLNNTVETSIAGDKINPYPNPVSTLQAYNMNASDSVVFKFVIVNNRLEVLTRSALKIKGLKNFSINFSDRSLYPNKGAIRMYFSFSATDKPNYKAGYGDIKICEGADNCF